LFGLALLSDYLKNHFFKEFHVTQWGLICPIVAFAVLGSFVYSTFIPSPYLYVAIVTATIISMIAFLGLLFKQAKCANLVKIGKTACE
jgi:hypothetical protein